jgi:hypothetical protein
MALRVVATLLTVGTLAFFYLPGWIMVLKAKRAKKKDDLKRFPPWFK